MPPRRSNAKKRASASKRPSKAFTAIAAGLENAIAFAKGDHTRGRVVLTPEQHKQMGIEWIARGPHGAINENSSHQRRKRGAAAKSNLLSRPARPRFSFAVCILNDECPSSLELRKIYRLIPDADAKAIDCVRVIDESGEPYVYPSKHFAEIQIAPKLSKLLSALR